MQPGTVLMLNATEAELSSRDANSLCVTSLPQVTLHLETLRASNGMFNNELVFRRDTASARWTVTLRYETC